MNRLTLTNNTGWDTRDLRRFILAGLKAEVGTWYNYAVVVDNQKSNGCLLGKGGYNRNWVRLLIPRTDQAKVSHLQISQTTLRQMANTLVHEVQHNKGLHHKDIAGGGWVRSDEVDWCERLLAGDFCIHRAPQPKPKPIRDLQAERQKHAQKMLDKHEVILKREQKLAKKWRAKVRYYAKAMEKKAAARKAE